MDLLTLMRVVLRRWPVLAVGLVLAATVAYLVHENLEPLYEAKGQILIAPGAPVSDEPLADETMTGPSPGVVSPEILAEILGGSGTRAQVVEAGGVRSYDAHPESESGILRLTAYGGSEAELTTSVDTLLAIAEQLVDDRQEAAGIPLNERISVEVLTSADSVEPEFIPDPVTGEEEEVLAATGAVLFSGLPTGGRSPYTASPYTADVLQKSVNSDEHRQEFLRRSAAPADYQISTERQDSAPVLHVTTSSTDPDGAIGAFDVVHDMLTEELADRHAASGSAEHPPARLDPLSTPLTAEQIAGNELRPVITVFGLGVVVVLTGIVLLDYAMESRRRRRAQPPEGPDDGGLDRPDMADDSSFDWPSPARS